MMISFKAVKKLALGLTCSTALAFATTASAYTYTWDDLAIAQNQLNAAATEYSDYEQEGQWTDKDLAWDNRVAAENECLFLLPQLPGDYVDCMYWAGVNYEAAIDDIEFNLWLLNYYYTLALDYYNLVSNDCCDPNP